MSQRFPSIAIAGLLATATFMLYALGPPPATSADESVILAQAATAASHPLFFHVEGASWLLPVPVYFAAVLGRSATALMGALDVALLYLVATRLLTTGWLAVATALILALTPVHAYFSQVTAAPIYCVPFALGWLYSVLAFLDLRRPRWLFLAGLCLGAGVYTQPSAPITMSAFLLLTMGAVLLERHGSWQIHSWLVAGFTLPLLLMVPWFAMHPETYPDTIGAWAIQKAHIRFPLDGIRAFLNWNTLTTRASIYRDTLNPSFLFMGAEAARELGTTGPPLAFSLAVLVPAGIARALSSMPASIALVLVGGLLASPMAAATFGQLHPLGGALPVVVFIALLGGLGATRMLESRAAWIRTTGVVLLVLIPVQLILVR